MTSVRNRLLQLSGSNILALFSALVLLSCNAFKVVSNDEPVVINDNTSEQKEEPEKKSSDDERIKTDTKQLITVDFYGKEYQVEPHKKEFKVALILPFHYDATTVREKRTSDYMLTYYQGVKLALNNLDMNGLQMKLYVFDDESNLTQLSSILRKSTMKSMDMIIGSVGEKQIKMVSEFGLKHDIPVVSPFTTLDSLDHPNPKLYCPTPSNAEKSQGVISFLDAYHPKSAIMVVSDETSYSKEMKDRYMEGFKAAKRKTVGYEDAKYNGWGNVLSKDETTVVILLSRNPTTVSTTLSKIYQTKRDVIVIGDYSWSNFQDNDYKFWDKMKVHLVASDYVNDTSASVQNFRINFRLVNRTDPSVYAYIGYDQFMFMGEFLMAFGEFFPSYIIDQEFRYLSSNFHYTYEDGLNKNTNVFILKFEDFELKPVE